MSNRFNISQPQKKESVTGSERRKSYEKVFIVGSFISYAVKPNSL